MVLGGHGIGRAWYWAGMVLGGQLWEANCEGRLFKKGGGAHHLEKEKLLFFWNDVDTFP